MNPRITIFDTTLRDGEQSPGCSMTPAEKIRLARQIERLGADIIEAGFPIASAGEVDSVCAVAEEIRGVKIAALARAKEPDILAAGKALRGAAHPVLHMFLATSGIHLKWKLKLTPEEALKQAVEGIKLAKSLVSEVEFSAEDATRTDYGYLREVLQATFEAGATTLNVPDTVGYSLPHEYAELIGRLVRDVPGAVISVHCHNDLGVAVANSLAAVQAGARQVECTINGIGERAGNASLEEIVMALKVRGSTIGAETGVKSELLALTSRLIEGEFPNYRQLLPEAYESRLSVGRQLLIDAVRRVGLLARDTTPVRMEFNALGVRLSPEEVEAVTARVKQLADAQKYVYDDDLLNLVGSSQARSIRLVRFQAFSGSQVLPTATVEVEVDGETRSASAVGNGPVDAALKAADAALGLDLELLELTTRAVTGGKDAMAEVLVRVRHDGAESSGQGASTDTIEAALKAYLSAVATARAAHEQPSLAEESA